MDISRCCRRILAYIFVCAVSYQTVCSLECYTCVDQETNTDKCVKTTKQCPENQDICITTIKWQLPPYWTPYGDRFYSISKDCDTTAGCELKKRAMLPHCKRDWYDDWSCIECSNGDLSNYYVTLDAGSLRPWTVLILTCLSLAWFAQHVHRIRIV